MDRGFTYFPSSTGGSGSVSFGIILKNSTAKRVTQVTAFVNFYDAAGRLIQTEKDVSGADYLAPRDIAKAGDIVTAKGAISSMKVTVVCAEQSATGADMQDPPLLKRLPFTGSVTAVEDGALGDSTVAGTFTNRGKAAVYSGTPTFVLRDAQGRIVGGDNMNTGGFGAVPPGLEIAWTITVDAPFPVGTRAEGTVGFWGAIYN